MIIAKRNVDLVVRPRLSPRRKLFFGALGVLGVIALVGAAYNYGLSRAGFVRADAARQQQKLGNRIKQLEDENTAFREMLARAERQLQIDRTAYQELDAALQESTRNIADLRKELNFYRKVISPATNQRGLQIQGFKIERSGIPDQHRYKLVLIQAFNQRRLIKGKLVFEVLGIKAGQQKIIRLPETKGSPRNVKFRYFQNIEGIFTLPPDFEPLRIKVSVTTNDRRVSKVERWYAWPLA